MSQEPFAFPIICTSFVGDPTFGPVLRTGQARVLVGWTHQNDNPEALLEGRIWGWTSRHDHFQVYDTSGNRSRRAGEVVFCGPANFTMIRMFHPYFCPNRHIPKDMNIEDKKRCRELYRILVRTRAQQTLSNQGNTQASSEAVIEISDSSDEDMTNFECFPERFDWNMRRSPPDSDTSSDLFVSEASSTSSRFSHF